LEEFRENAAYDGRLVGSLYKLLSEASNSASAKRHPVLLTNFKTSKIKSLIVGYAYGSVFYLYSGVGALVLADL
jgi:hypothetical protein